MPRRAHPDGGVLDPDRGSASPGTKQSEMMSTSEWVNRDANRGGLRDLDERMESMPGMTRQQRDRDRIFPRAATAAMGHPRMDRPLPDKSERRTPLSSRQKKARSVTRQQVKTRQPLAQRAAQRKLVSELAVWNQINDQLSDAVGDIQALSPQDHQLVKRVDRSIQAYERHNDRGHRVYVNARMPQSVNHTSLAPFVHRNFGPGDVVAFDRFSAGAHQLHEIETHDPAGRTAVFEIHTRRGAYLGGSDTVDNTAHLLPRGMELLVIATQDVTYSRPDGSVGHRLVIQLEDITPI